MRKLSAVFCVFLCLVGLSVSAFAYVPVEDISMYANVKDIIYVSGDTLHMNIDFPQDILGDSEFIETYLKIKEDMSDDSRICGFSMLNNSVYMFSFDAASFKADSYSGSGNQAKYSSDDTSICMWQYNSSTPVQITSHQVLSTLYCSYSMAVWVNNSPDQLHASQSYLDVSNISVNDNVDGDEPDPPSSSEPDPPSIPETSFPEVGLIENEYVPYDTRYWNEFSDLVLAYIGSSTNVGFLCLAIILGLWLIIRIVKHFTKG